MATNNYTLSSPESFDSAVVTPPLWPMAEATAGDAEAFIRASFPRLVSTAPQRAVLLVPDATLYLAYRALRLFRDAGVAVDLLCPAGHPLTHSRYVRHGCTVTDWSEVEARMTHFLRSPQRPWKRMLVAHEPSARRLIGSLDASALANWQPGAAVPGVKAFFQGKFGLLGAQARWGLPVPPSRICHSVDEVRAFATEIGGAIIVKPSEEMGGLGIKKFPNAAAVAAAGKSLKFPLLAQKFIVGRRIVLELFCSGGRLLGWMASYSIAQANGPFSYSTGRQFRAMPALQPLAELVAHTGFEGFGGLDCLEEDGTGQVYVMEFNPRHSSGWRFARDCGADFVPAVAAWVDGKPSLTPITQAPDREVTAHYFPTDLVRCLRQRDWAGLKNWLPGAKSRHDICWDDPMPFLASTLGRFSKKLRSKAAKPPTAVTP